MIVSTSPELVRVVIAEKERAATEAALARAVRAAQACCRAASGQVRSRLARLAARVR